MLKEFRVQLIVTGWYKNYVVKNETVLAILSRFLKEMKTCCYKVIIQTLYRKPGEEKLDDNFLCTAFHPFQM